MTNLIEGLNQTGIDLAKRVAKHMDDLKKGHEGRQQLKEWLVGTYLPPLGGDDEPWVWLGRGLNFVAEANLTIPRFAMNASLLLKEANQLRLSNIPSDDVGWEERRQNGLFNFCATLGEIDPSVPIVLASPLRDSINNIFVLNEAWGGLIRMSLIRALIVNQPDRGLSSLWQGMIRRKPDMIIKGTPTDGFNGITHIPADQPPDQQVLDAIGEFLADTSRDMKDIPPYRVSRFRNYIQVLTEHWPEYSWGEELRSQAVNQNWSPWAVVYLEEHFKV